MNDAVERIEADGKLLAIIIYRSFKKAGIHFFTPDNLSQQLAYMHHPAGKVIGAHVHNPIPREVTYTQEVLLVKKGELRVDFYDTRRSYLHSRILKAGDVILLVAGGHGFEVLEDVEMIEIKQGPHVGEEDKTRFEGINRDDVEVKDRTDD